MPTYRVYIQQTIDGHVDVQADNRDEARAKVDGDHGCCLDTIEQDGDEDFVILDVEEIEEA